VIWTNGRECEITWWLDRSALPDLFWARLRYYDARYAEVLDLDGQVHRFPTKEEAADWLREDEYSMLDDLIDDGEVSTETMQPTAPSDAELIPKMRTPHAGNPT
jgi:hypothetical protein